MNVRRFFRKSTLVLWLVAISFLNFESMAAPPMFNEPGNGLWNKGWCCVTTDSQGNIIGLQFMMPGSGFWQIWAACSGANQHVSINSCHFENVHIH